MPNFHVKSVKIYTGQKRFTREFSWLSWQISGMHLFSKMTWSIKVSWPPRLCLDINNLNPIKLKQDNSHFSSTLHQSCTLYFRNPGKGTCLKGGIPFPLQAPFSSMHLVFGTGFSSGPGLNRNVRRVEGKVLKFRTSQILLQLRLHTQSSPTLASVTFRPIFCHISLLCERACSSEPVLSFPFLVSDPR